MLRRLAARGALVATAALMLVGCTPPEPSETTPAASTSDEQLLSEASSSFAHFYDDVDSQFEKGEASAVDLEEHATPAFASEFAQQIQTALDRGEVSRGVLAITELEIKERLADGFLANMCTSAEGIETTEADGDVRRGEGVDAWTVAFVRGEEDRLLIASLDVSEDRSICGT